MTCSFDLNAHTKSILIFRNILFYCVCHEELWMLYIRNIPLHHPSNCLREVSYGEVCETLNTKADSYLSESR